MKILYSRLPSGPVQAAGMYCKVDDLTWLYVPINLINLPIYLPSARALDYRTCSYLWVAFHDEIFLFVVQGEKRQPYDEDIRVPLIVRGPKVPSNMNTSALALNIDLVRNGSFRMLWIWSTQYLVHILSLMNSERVSNMVYHGSVLFT